MDRDPGYPAGPDRSLRPVPPPDDEARTGSVLPTITCVQTGWTRRRGRDVALYAVVSEAYGVLCRDLSKAGALTFARNHLYWLDALGQYVPDPAEAFVPGPDW